MILDFGGSGKSRFKLATLPEWIQIDSLLDLVSAFEMNVSGHPIPIGNSSKSGGGW